MMKRMVSTQVFGCVAVLFFLSGCTALWQQVSGSKPRHGASSSLVEYLYPEGEEPPQTTSVPELKLPLHIGIAFVPSFDLQAEGLSEAHRMELLEGVKRSFADTAYIQKITVIPDAYLHTQRGFTGLEQVAHLYGLDIIALVSYDQSVYSSDKKSAIFYWTIAGAYLIEASKNDIQTFVDIAIIDPKTRQLLVRAPGIDTTHENSTLLSNAEDLRKAREKSYDQAVQNMVANMKTELKKFQLQIQQNHSVKIATRAGYSSGGSTSPAWLALLLVGLIPRLIHKIA